MNKRILELAERAEIAANKGDHVDVKIMMEKFAELIVKECAGIYDAIDNGNLVMGADNYLEALTKRFGNDSRG